MRQHHARAVARCFVGIECEVLAVLQLHRAFGERAEPQFRALQIDQDADRTAIARLDVADGFHQLAHLVVRRVAHVDAEHVGAGFEQPPYHGAVGGSRAKRCEDLDAAKPSHGLPGAAGGGAIAAGGAAAGGAGSAGPLPGAVVPGMLPGLFGSTVPGSPGTFWPGCCSLDSVSCTVQARCSPVSTSKKPVRSKPRARQLSVPLMVNSLSREHMKACPDHSPPRS